MRLLLIMWIAPFAIFWGWLALARMDAFPNSIIFSRILYDEVFRTYEALTGFGEGAIVSLLAKATVVDLLIVAAIYAFRRRKQIRQWWSARRNADAVETA